MSMTDIHTTKTCSMEGATRCTGREELHIEWIGSLEPAGMTRVFGVEFTNHEYTTRSKEIVGSAKEATRMCGVSKDVAHHDEIELKPGEVDVFEKPWMHMRTRSFVDNVTKIRRRLDAVRFPAIIGRSAEKQARHASNVKHTWRTVDGDVGKRAQRAPDQVEEWFAEVVVLLHVGVVEEVLPVLQLRSFGAQSPELKITARTLCNHDVVRQISRDGCVADWAAVTQCGRRCIGNLAIWGSESAHDVKLRLGSP